MRGFTSRVVTEEAVRLSELGWVEVPGGSGHRAFTHPDHGRISLPNTPQDEERWRQNFRTRVARAMDLTRTEVDARLGIRRRGQRSGPKIRRKRNEAGRAARTFTVVKDEKPKPERVGTVAERMESIANEIAAVDQGLNYAAGDEYDSLLSERARLRQEYMQLDADRKAAA